MEEEKKTKPTVDTEHWPRPSDEILSILLDKDKKNFEADKNPLSLIGAFNTAYHYGLPIPEWVLNNLYKVFQEYLKTEGKKSLDHIFGFKGKKGPGTTAFSKGEIKKRDMLIMSVIHGWKSLYGLSIADAAVVACVEMEECFPKNPEWYISNPEQLRKNFSTKRWDIEFKDGNPLGRAMVLNLNNDQFDHIIAALKRLHRPDIVEKLETRRAAQESTTIEENLIDP